MSTTLFGYLEASTNYNAESKFNCITHKASFDGFEFTDDPEILPDIAYTITPDAYAYYRKELTGVKNLTSGQLSADLYREYQTLSDNVTGRDNSLRIYSMTIGALVDNYNRMIHEGNCDHQLLCLLTSLIRKLANSYYYQLDVSGDPYLLNPDQTHEIRLSGLVKNRVRLVTWLDA